MAEKKEKILVTGGAGYIGSHCCKNLYLNGYLPICLDNFSKGNRYAVQWGPLVEGDISDKNYLKEIFSKNKISGVMHFAADSLVGESFIDPVKYYSNNVKGTLHLLEIMQQFGVKNFIFSSSCATYGEPKEIPITEDHPQHPISPYGRTKFMIEAMLKDFSLAYGMRFISLRYFNAAGADLNGDIGEDHANETHLLPLIIFAAQGKIPQIKVFGKDFPTKDGTAIRDYIHVVDLAQAHMLALNYLQKHKKSHFINLGTGTGYSVLEIIQGVEKFIGKKIPYAFSKKREGDPPILMSNSILAKKILKWEPKFSSIETIIESAWLWHEKNK